MNAPELVALARAGATFIDGQLQERTSEEDGAEKRDAAWALGDVIHNF